MTRSSVYSLVTILSALTFCRSTAQLISDHIVPKPFQTTDEASFIGQCHGEQYLIVRSGYDDYVPVFERWYGLYEASLLRVDQSGIPIRFAAFDTSRYEHWGLGGWTEEMEYSAASHPAGSEIVIGWHHQRAYWSDVPPPNADRPRVRFARVSSSGLTPIIVVDSSQNPRPAVDASGDAHFIWEQRTPFPYTPQPGWPTYDSNYFFATGKVVYQKGITGNPTVIGKGFRPLMAIDEQDTVHIAWLRADSSHNSYADLMYRKGRNGIFAGSETLRVSLPFVDPYSPHQMPQRTQLLNLSVQPGTPVRIFWTGPRSDGSGMRQMYIVTRLANNTWQLDSLNQVNPEFLVAPNGVIHALWSVYQSGWYTLQYATSASIPPFSDIRSFRLRNSGGGGKLLRNSSGVLSAITRDGTVLGYVPDVAAGPDTLIPFGVSGSYPSGNFATLDGQGHLWVCYSRSGQSDTLRLLQFEPVVLSVGYGDELPGRFELHQNYPNPFNPSTTIKYDLPEAGFASLMVFDILGREVATLIDADHQAGYHAANFNAEGLSSGVYFVRLRVMDRASRVLFTKSSRLLLMK